MVDWHPRALAQPQEWRVVVPGRPEPIAVIRLLEIDERRVFRAVTWARGSEQRRLIGYYPTGDDAAVAAWRRYCDQESIRHEAASKAHGRQRPDA